MNAIVLAGLHGLVKRAIAGPGDGAGVVHPADAAIFGPIREELKYRAALDATAPGFSDFASAAAFAFAHYNAGEAPEVSRLRVADAFVGGLIYAKAFRDFGLVGAVAAHAVHNVVAMSGTSIQKTQPVIRIHRRRR